MTEVGGGSATVEEQPPTDGTGDADNRGLPPNCNPPDSSGPRPGQQRTAMIVVLAVVVVAGAIAAAVAVPQSSSPPKATSAGTVQPPANPALAASPGGTELDPSMFESGSCVAFSPTAGDRHQTVFLDAGHGGIDPGASGATESGATHPRSGRDPPRRARGRQPPAGPGLPGGGLPNPSLDGAPTSQRGRGHRDLHAAGRARRRGRP